MKKLLALCIGLMLVFHADAQKRLTWFDFGLKAQYGYSGLYNSAVVDNPDIDYQISNGYSYGAKLGINKDYSGIAIEVMSSKWQQEFDPINSVIEANPEIFTTIDWEAIDLYLLLRHNKNLGFFEIGPKFSFLRSVEGTNTTGAVTDIKEDYKKNGISGVVSFGALIMGTDGRFSGQLGLRFEYGFTDMVDDPATSGAPIGNPGLIYTDGTKSTNPIFAGIVFELNWGIGYFGIAKCGGRSKFIMF